MRERVILRIEKMRRPKIDLPSTLKAIVEKNTGEEMETKLCEGIDKLTYKDPNIIMQTRRYKLITPLFGGGVEAGINDDLTPISGKAIRGHLRFWWRATCGVGTVDEMKKAEEAIWGAASTKNKKMPSMVIVEILEIIKKEKKKEPAFTNTRNSKGKLEPKPSNSIAQYVAFPLLPDKDERKNPKWTSSEVWSEIEFTIQLKYPKEVKFEIEDEIFEIIDIETEINSALWVWGTFGGIGARTRRGFGALQLLEIDGKEQKTKTVDEFKQSIRKELTKQLAKGKWDNDVPHLLPNSLIAFTKNRKSDPIKAWKELIDKLQDFRQSPRVQREFKFSGRSNWSEPDAIRRMTTNAIFRPPEHPVNNKFPRAVFGLPIGFKFKDEDKNDPPETFLEGREKSENKSGISRLASPLILRPIACSDGAIGLALILQSTRIPPEGVYLYYKTGRRKVAANSVEVTLTSGEAKNIYPIEKQLTKLGTISHNDPDLVLKAFLKYVEE